MHHVSASETLERAPVQALPDGLWVVDREASTVGFAVRHLAVATVHGRFTGFEGWIDTSATAGGQVGGRVEVASVETGVGLRDERLRSADCFDVQRHPWMTFEGELVRIAPDFAILGDLTLMDRTRPLRLVGALRSVEPDRVTVDVRGTVRRRAYDLTWRALLDKGLPVVADAVTIRLDVTLRRHP